MARKDKNDSKVFKYLLSQRFKYDWGNYSENKEINKVLRSSSKNGSGNAGFPDFIYVNEESRLLILVEVKPTTSLHTSQSSKVSPEKFAVDGIVHYLSMFKRTSLGSRKLDEYFSPWKIVGLAISGDIDDEYNHRVSTFIILEGNVVEQRGITSILHEDDYLNLFDNIDEEKIIGEISTSSKKINKWLRSVDSQKRPILLSALMICLFDLKDRQNDFRVGYNSWSSQTIIQNIPITVTNILALEKIPIDKIELIKSELGFLQYDNDLNTTSTIKDILNELRDFVIPLFDRKSNYDIIGKFYEEFLRYAGVANVKKGIVLTPRHITSLFTDLVDIKYNDVFLDPACGTGAFLISAMNRLIDSINSSSIQNKDEVISKLKSRQLIGFEKNATMYTLAISNMMFRGDGKSQIFYNDFFSKQADDEFKNLGKEGIIPTIGFINPPYGGKDNEDNPTKKEIQFLARMLDHVSRYGIIIAPLSTYFKDDSVRNSLLRKHTLRYVINMPNDLFMPNAATNTAIAVFETHKPHGNQEVVFYDLKEDGFVLTKLRGRTDTYNRWNKVKSDMLVKLLNPDAHIDGINLVKKRINENDEWIIQAHSDTDFSRLNANLFVSTIKDFMVFKAKRDMNLLDKSINEIDLLNVLANYFDKTNERLFSVSIDSDQSNLLLDVSSWYPFKTTQLFDTFHGSRLVEKDRIPGSIPLITAGYLQQGIAEFISNDELETYAESITIDMFANCFYRDYEFKADDNIYILKPKKDISIQIALFIVTIINLDKFKFQYGRQFRQKHLDRMHIRLPRNQSGDPDWEYMEQYIKSLPYSENI